MWGHYTNMEQFFKKIRKKLQKMCNVFIIVYIKEYVRQKHIEKWKIGVVNYAT